MEKEEEAGGTQVVGWNLAAMSQEDMEMAEELWRLRANDRAHIGAENTGDEVESEAEWCQEALSKVLDITAKKITICAYSKRCWNGEIKEKRSQLGREKRTRRRSEATAQAKAELQMSVRRAKDKMWNDFLKILRGVEVWRTAKCANPRAGITVEAFTDRDGKQANMIAEKEEMLTRESSPPDEYDQYLELLPAGQAHQSVTEQAVETARFPQSIKKVPRPAKLSFGAVCLLWKWDKERIVELAKSAVQTGRHPAVWNQASGVVIRKPGKDNYMKPKAYRSISLLSCMGKVIEKVVAELLAE